MAGFVDCVFCLCLLATGLVCHQQDCSTSPCSPLCIEYCGTDEDYKIEHYCQALYELREGVYVLRVKSCLVNVYEINQCTDREVCVLQSLGDNLTHCCCQSNLCNAEIEAYSTTLSSGSPPRITGMVAAIFCVQVPSLFHWLPLLLAW